MPGPWIAAGLLLALAVAAPAGAQDGATGQTLEQLEGLEEEAAGGSGAPAAEPLTKTEAAAVDPDSSRAWLGVGAGGLSGPAVRPIALAQVRVVSAAISIPVIGMGGITDSESALEFILAGARVIAVGTENFRDPRAGSEVTAGLPAALTRRGFGSLAEAQSVTFG